MGKQYQTINTIRSAISMTHQKIDGMPVRQHPLVSRFLKGVFISHPPAPKYTTTWDVDIVQSQIRDIEDNDRLSFQLLTHKLAMLMALTNTDRCSNLAGFSLSYRTYQRNGVKFVISGLTKMRHSGPMIEAFYPAFLAVSECLVHTFQCYEKRSQTVQAAAATTLQKSLFISVRRPYKPVKAATIGHWLNSRMKSASINTDIFSTHSTHGASPLKQWACPWLTS